MAISRGFQFVTLINGDISRTKRVEGPKSSSNLKLFTLPIQLYVQFDKSTRKTIFFHRNWKCYHIINFLFHFNIMIRVVTIPLN